MQRPTLPNTQLQLPTVYRNIEDKAVADYLSVLVPAILDLFEGVVSKSNPVPFLLLSSPDGSVWQVKVSNAGVLSATLQP